MSDNKIIAYKAFDKDLKCRDFQYAVGETYTYDGEVKASKSGFHACVNPLDVLAYYDLCNSRFALVEQSGAMDRHEDDSKIASATITIKAELRLPEFIKAAVDWMLKDAKADAASGNGSQLAASGNDSQLAASGNDSQLAESGYGSKLAASGNGSKLAASGNDSQLAASGDDSKLAASGDGSQLAASGDDSIVMAAALQCKAKAGNDGCIALTWYEGKRYRVSVGYVGEGLKPDTWYELDGAGEFVEASC